MKQPRGRKRQYGRRPPITLAAPAPERPHNRKATEIPINAKVAPIEVDDPFASAGESVKIVVLRSIKTDPLGDLHARDQIDDAQFHAGRHWQWLYERSSVGSVQAVNTMKEPVDGGGMPEPITDGQILAMGKLRKANAQLKSLARIVEDVLGRGMFVPEAARARGLSTARDISFIGQLLHQALDILVVEFNLANRPGRRRVASTTS